MEDQQSASGDLTDVSLTDAAETSDAESVTPSSLTPMTRCVALRRWLVGKRGVLMVGVCALIFVFASSFAGAAAQSYFFDRAALATKLVIARTSAEAITTLWTYTPEDMGTLPDRSTKYLSNDFDNEYRKYIDAIAATNKQAQVTNNTEVVGVAVESLRDNEATAIVYTNTTSTTPLNKNIPALKYLSYRLQLHQHNTQWLITRMTTVTSLDITPQR